MISRIDCFIYIVFHFHCFSDQRKPIFDSKLKSRIDNYVLKINTKIDVVFSQPPTAKKSKIDFATSSSSSCAENINIAKNSSPEENNFNYQGSNLDALLNQALQGKDRILSSGDQRPPHLFRNKVYLWFTETVHF